MKMFSFLSTAALAMVLGVSVPVFAQQEDAHPQEDKRTPEDKPTQDQDKKVQQDDKHPDKTDKEDRSAERQDKNAEQQDKRAEQQDKRAEQVDKTAERNAGNGRIPEERFRANFGRQHTFHVGHPVIVAGAPRFQYGGYWFVIVQPWPVGWAYTDEVYVDYINGGYFLLSPVHPGIQISINVIL